MALIRHWLATALAFLLVAYYLPGFRVLDPMAAVVASAVLGLLNAIVRPILLFFTLPLTLFTLGLFILVINGLMMWGVGVLVPGIRIHDFGTAMVAALLVSLASWLIGGVLKALTRK
ncbi:MAG TPA: phage holin family protein [Stenomitos sp.]